MITYAGIGMVEPSAKLQAHFDQWWKPEFGNLFTTFPGVRADGIGHLPRPVNTQLPPQLGVLRWPEGASRWASFVGLVSQSQYDQIAAASSPAPLVLDDGTTTIAATMYRMPAYAVCQFEERELYLIVLVDERFWWWAAGADSTQQATWADQFSTLFSAIGVTATVDAIPAVYGAPTNRWNVGRKPIPLLLDAAARSVGVRIIRTTGGDVRAIRPDAARSLSDDRWERYGGLFSGGGSIQNIGDGVPESVDVIFPGNPNTVLPVYLASLSLPEYGTALGVPGWAAQMTVDVLSADADTATADQAAADWYAWQAGLYEGTLRAFVPWELTGFEEWVEWGHQDKKLWTRIVRPSLWDANVYGSVLPPTTELTVRESDTSPTVTPAGTITFNSARFALTDLGSGEVYVDSIGDTPAPITTGNVGPAASGSTADESTGTLYAANSTGAKIRTQTTGTRVLENLEAYLSQWGVVSDNDQRFTGDKRILDASAEAGRGWVVGTFGETRASVFPSGYTVLTDGSLQLLGPDTGTIGPNNWFWSENRSFGVINKVNPDAEGASAGLASVWAFVPPKGTAGESYAGHVVRATADTKTAQVLTGAGLTAPTDSGFAGYYPAFSYYVSTYGDTVTLWVGADQTSTHSRAGLNRGFPADRADGLLELHFRLQGWEPLVPGVPPSPPTAASASGDMLISRLHVGLDDAANYPGTPREPLHVWPDDANPLPDADTTEGGIRHWVKRNNADDVAKLWPGIDFDFTGWGSQEPWPYVPIVRAGLVVAAVKMVPVAATTWELVQGTDNLFSYTDNTWITPTGLSLSGGRPGKYHITLTLVIAAVGGTGGTYVVACQLAASGTPDAASAFSVYESTAGKSETVRTSYNWNTTITAGQTLDIRFRKTNTGTPAGASVSITVQAAIHEIR